MNEQTTEVYNTSTDHDQEEYSKQEQNVDRSLSNVVDIACAAKFAREQAELSNQYASSIIQLAKEASRRASDLHILANSLVATATSASCVFMSGSRFADLREAFDSHPSYKRKIDFLSFRNIVTKEIYSEDIDYSHWRKGSTGIGEETRVASTSSYKETHPIYTSEIQATTRPLRYSEKNYQQEEGKQMSWSTVLGSDDLQTDKKSKEKFPTSRSVMEYRDNLAASFDNKCGISPLWEDRYINVTNKETKLNSYATQSEMWMEKKALKQFQMKLHPGSNLDETTTHSISPAQCTDELQDTCTRTKCQEYVTSGLEYIKKGQLRPLVSKSGRLSDEETESDRSTDSEIDNILREPRNLRKLKNLTDHRIPCMAGEENEANRISVPRATKDRSLSPLLNNTEKEHYTTHSEEYNTNYNSRPKYFTMKGGSPGPSTSYDRRK